MAETTLCDAMSLPHPPKEGVHTESCKKSGQPASMIGMPELPDITAYISALEPRIVGQPLEHVRVASAFLLRTARPPVASVEGRMVRELRRIGKRIAIGVEGDLWLVLHLMIAGPAALAAARGEAGGPQKSGCLRLPQRFPGAHRSGHQAPRFVASCSRVRTRCVPSTLVASTSSPATSILFATRSRSRIARSSGLLPIRAS